ncbi:MAG: hypothetical protein ACI9KE_005578 [Polyangiales bacterium]|jgi:hypothetical protein
MEDRLTKRAPSREDGSMKRVFYALLAIGSFACGGAEPADEPESADEAPVVTEDEVPSPGATRRRGPAIDVEGVDPLPPSFCAAYDTLRDAERLLSFGEGGVSLDQVDAVVASMRTLSGDAPRMLSAALDASARIYEEERTRIVGDQIADVLLERRSFNDERDLLLQLNVRQDYLSRACPDLDGSELIE